MFEKGARVRVLSGTLGIVLDSNEKSSLVWLYGSRAFEISNEQLIAIKQEVI